MFTLLTQFRHRATLIAVSCLAAGGLALTMALIWNGMAGSSKQRVAYIGLTCEAPLFVAYEQGFFNDEGLDVDLVATDWDGLREGIGMGRFDATQTLLMYLIDPIVMQGLDAKITGGVHTGCLRIQTGTSSSIKTVRDLQGKKIGVPTHLGSPPHLFASRVLVANGIDPSLEKEEVSWLVYPPGLLGKALEDGRVDAVATSDPIGTILVGSGLARTIADQGLDAPYRDEYCCVVVVNGKLARESPQTAAKLTRALLRASKWTEENPTAAARLAVEKNYTAASVEVNAQALAHLRYIPGVARCRRSLEQAAQDMRQAGLLKANFDPKKTIEKAWLDLDTVTDDWLQSLPVARVPSGGRPAVLAATAFAELCRNSKIGLSCCRKK